MFYTPADPMIAALAGDPTFAEFCREDEEAGHASLRPDPIITVHVSPYYSVQGTAAEVARWKQV